MAQTEETPVVAQAGQEVVRLSLPLKDACTVARTELVRNIIFFAISVYFICKYTSSEGPINHFLLFNIFIPLLAYNIIMIICTTFYIFALTQSTVRYLYIEVFYVNIFRKLVVIFFCVYMLVVIFTPHVFFNKPDAHSSSHIAFNNAYLIFAAAILSYALLDSSLVIIYICSIYFRIEKLRNFLSKYWFVRLIVMVAVDTLLVFYYLHCLILEFNPVFLVYLLLMLSKAAIIVWFLKREICAPASWQLKPLDPSKVPDSQKVKQAVRIMAMKAEVKEVADSAGAA